MKLLSIIVPCYNEEAALSFFLPAVRKAAAGLRDKHQLACEVLFIDDGSRDGTLAVLRGFAAQDPGDGPQVRYFSFSRNFGKEAALFAGFQHARGDYVVVMDADLQHPPAMLEEMFLALRDEGYDIAAARRVDRRGEPPIRSFFARMFYKVTNKISKADALLQMDEYNRFSKGIFGWVGFRTKWIPYENVERVAGETSWSFWKLLLYSIDGIVAFSTAPLSIASILGILFCLAAFVGMLVIFVKTLIWGDPVAGFPTLACLLLLIGGSIQLSLGIIGQYLAKTYLEAKHRPIYLLRESSDDKEAPT